MRQHGTFEEHPIVYRLEEKDLHFGKVRMKVKPGPIFQKTLDYHQAFGEFREYQFLP